MIPQADMIKAAAERWWQAMVAQINAASQGTRPLALVAEKEWERYAPHVLNDVGSLLAVVLDGREAAHVRASVIGTKGMEHVTVDSDLGLLRKLVENIGDDRPRRVRWAHVKDALGHGSTVSAAICRSLGLDPDEQVGVADEAGVYCSSCGNSVDPDDVDVCEACEAAECQSCAEDHDCIRVSDCDGEVSDG